MFCVHWPAGMKKLQECAAVLALDLFAESKAPCLFNDWDYYSKLHVSMATPFVITVFVVLVSFVWEALSRCQQQRGARRRPLALAQIKRSGDSLIVASMWRASPVALFILDMIYPLCCRTLCSFFSCRNLNEAGWWLEADFARDGCGYYISLCGRSRGSRRF